MASYLGKAPARLAIVTDDSVTSAKIVDNTVTSADILNATITGADLASDITINTTGTVTTSQLNLGDNEYIRLGASQDLQLYHDASNSYIKDAGTGDLRIEGNFVRLVDTSNGGTTATFASSGVNLRYSNNVKLTTVSSGIDVTGRGRFTGTSNTAGIFFDNSDFGTYDWEQYQDSSGQLIFTITGTGGAEMTLRNTNTASYTNAQLFVGGSIVATTNNTLNLSNKILTSPTITGNVAFDTNTLYVDATNNRVGIGTTSPDDLLHISTGTGLTRAVLKLSAASDQYLTLRSIHNGTTSEILSNYGLDLIANGSNDLRFYTNSSFRMVVNGSGNVGIGTTSPSYTLHSLGSGTDGAFAVFHNQGSGGAYSGVQIASDNLLGGGDSNTNLIMTRWNGTGTKVSAVKLGVETNSNDGVLTFSTAENADLGSSTYTERMRIDGDTGNIGIGTTSPSNQLHLYSDNTSPTPSLLIEQDGTGDAALSFKITDSSNALSMGLNNSNGDMFVISYNGTDVGAGTSAFTINSSSRVGILKSSTGGGNAKFQVGDISSFDNNVGIGTTSPSTLLHLSSADPQITITDTDGTGSQVIKASGDNLRIETPNIFQFQADNAGQIQLLDSTTYYGKIFRSGGFKIESVVADQDIFIRGNDGGVFFDALSFDMSEAGNATFNNNVTVGNDLTVTGNLIVNGTTTTVNTETINLADNTITLNSNETGTPSQDGGIEIERGTSTNKTLIWNETSDKWTVGSETFVAGTFEGALTGDVTGNADTATTLATARTIAGQSFDGSANITIASTDLSDTSSITLNTATQTLTNKTLTSPTITGRLNVTGTPIAIGNDNIQVDFSAPEGRIQSKNSTASPASNLGLYTTDTGGTTNKVVHINYQQRVGINTTSPSAALHVVPPSGTTGLVVNANDSYFGNVSSGDYVDVGNLGDVGNVYLDARGTSSNINIQLRAKGSDGRIIFLKSNGGTILGGFQSDGDFYIDTDTLYVDAVNDRVGINTSTPADPFVVAYSTGEIRFGGTNGRTLSAYQNGSLSNFDFKANQTYFESDFLINGSKKISTHNGSTDNLYLTTTDSSKSIYTDRSLIVDGDVLIDSNIVSEKHSVSPTLNLDFKNTKNLDSRITFTRGSNATYYDGYTSVKAEENLVRDSQDFDNSDWAKQNTTVTANSTTAPDGTNTAETLTESTASAQHAIWDTQYYISGKTYVHSIFVKANGRTKVQLLPQATSVVCEVRYDLSAVTSTSVGTGSPISHAITDVGNSWYRISVVFTATATGTGYIQLNLLDASNNKSYTGDGTSGVYLWGAQVEQRDSLTAYTATSGTPITKYQPVLQTAGNNVARFNHDPVTGESLGLLIEENQTNLQIYSEDLTNSNWSKTRSAVISNYAVAPDGTNTADLIVTNGTTGIKIVADYATFSPPANSTYTASVYVKNLRSTPSTFKIEVGNGSNNSIASFDIVNGSVSSTSNSGTVTHDSANIEHVGNGWYRCSMTLTHTASWTSPNTNIAVYDNTSDASNLSEGILVWGIQIEEGSWLTSYIKTTSSTVTRSADDVTISNIDSSDWFEQGQGTFYTDFKTIQPFDDIGNGSDSSMLFNLNDGEISANRYRMETYIYEGGYIAGRLRVDATNYDSVLPSSYTINSGKSVFKYDNTGIKAAFNTTSASTNTSAPYIPAFKELRIGRGSNVTGYINGHIKKFSYYPLALSDNEIVKLSKTETSVGEYPTMGDLGKVAFSDKIHSSQMANVVSLQILNSSGTVVKTIYGAGS